MEIQIKIFENPQFGNIRTAGTSEQPLFCLADVCRVLELQTGATKNRLNERGISLINTPTTNQHGAEVMQQMVFINEQNLYKVIMRSDKPQAEAFQDWVCGEVLPSIRKNGGYMIAKDDDTNEVIMARALLIADEAMKRKDKQIEELNTKVQQDKPKVVFADAITGSNTSILIGELAKLIRQNCPKKSQKGYNIGQNRLYEWMRENDYIGKSGNFYNVPNQRYIEQGLFKLRTNSFSVNGKMLTKNTTLVTGKGQQYFINKFLAEEGAERELDF